MIISDSISFPKNIFLSFIHKNNTAQSGQSDKCVGFGAKLTFTADEEDDKSIYNHRENAEEPAENPKPRFH